MSSIDHKPAERAGFKFEDSPIHGFDYGAQFNKDYFIALEHIYGRLDLERIDPTKIKTVDRNLDVYKDFLSDLDSPQRSVPIIHITGTKGKGSTVVQIESILRQAGYSTGSTISPHLVEVRERIRINKEDISRQKFADIYNKQVRPVVDSRHGILNFRTVFEVMIATAFLAFKQEKVDVAVVEVGMGGKLDATNVVNPEVSVITRVGLDHVHVLGNTTGEIAADKAHIIKAGKPAVIGPQDEDALKSIISHAEKTESPLWICGRDFHFTVKEVSNIGTTFDLVTPLREWKNLRTPLLGRHQAENAAVAVATIDRLVFDHKYDVKPEDVYEGLLQVRWNGRGEIVSDNPLIMIDGAHNVEGAKVLKTMIDDCWPERKPVFVFGFNKDKNVAEFLEHIGHKSSPAIATAIDFPRAMPAEEIQRIAKESGWDMDVVNVDHVLSHINEICNNENIVIITGSLYIVGSFKRKLLHGSESVANF